MIIRSKSLTSEELSKIEAEWGDSKTVCELLGHISYLTDTILDLVSKDEQKEKKDGTGKD